jgi:hypothetical protein
MPAQDHHVASASGIQISTSPFPCEESKSELYCSNSGASASMYPDSGSQVLKMLKKV